MPHAAHPSPGRPLRVSRTVGVWLGKAGAWSRGLVPDRWRAWRSPCTDAAGEPIPRRLRPFAPCIICGSVRFTRWRASRPLSRSGRFCRCARCGSLQRHRALRKVMAGLRRKEMKQARCLQISTDPTVKPVWFGRYELSTYGGDNAIDVQSIDRPDASYDVIVCNHVLEHVPDHRRALRELGRILSERGFIFLSVPSPGRRARTEDWGWPDPARWKHYREFGADFADLLRHELPALAIIELRPVDDATGDPDVAYILTRSRIWYRWARLLPVRQRVRARRPLAA